MATAKRQQTSHPRPKRPVLLYDGDCGFCAGWVERWKRSVGESVSFRAYQESADEFPQVAVEDLRQASHLVDPDGSIHRGARAIFGALDRAPGGSLWLTAYRRVPGFAAICEAVYRFVANHRGLAMTVQRLFWGRRPEPFAPLKRAAAVSAIATFVWLITFVASPASAVAPPAGQGARFGSPRWSGEREIIRASRAMLLLTGMAIGAVLFAWRLHARRERMAHRTARRESDRRSLVAATTTIELIEALRELAALPKSDASFPILLAEVIALRQRRRSLIEQETGVAEPGGREAGPIAQPAAQSAILEMPPAEIMRWVRASAEDWNSKRTALLCSLRRGARAARAAPGDGSSRTQARAARMIRIGCAELGTARKACPSQGTECEDEPTPSGAFASARV